MQSKPKEAVTHLLLLTSYLLTKMEPKYKVNPLTGELQEYVFEYNGILALRNFTARVEDERLILHSADDVNFSILEALVSEVEINGVLYNNPTAAQEALTRLTFNQNRPVLLDKSLKDLILGAVQKVEGKGLSSNDFTNSYKQQLDALEDYDIELDESTTELKFKKGNNVVRRISLMFLDDEGTKLVYNKVNKNLELRDKRDNLLTSIPVSHFVSNIPTSIVVQNGKIKLMSGSEVIDENAISYNDLADKPELNYLPLNGGTVTGDVSLNGDLLIKDKTTIHVRDNGNIAFGNKPFNDLVIGEFKGIQLWGQGNDKVVLAGGGVTNLSELKNENVKVGGRNLITDSKNERYKEYKGTVEDYIYYGIVGGTLEENTTYTLSLEYKSENVRSIDLFFINENISQTHNKNIPNTNGEWKRETFTFTTNPNLSPKGSIRIDNNGSDTGNVTSKLWTRNVKLERGNIATDWTPAPEDIESKIPQYKTINDVHTFLDKNGSIHFGSGSNILNAPSSHFYEMVGFTHSDKNWGFIIAKNIDTEDKQLWVKQVIGGTYKEWFKLEDRSQERTINVTASTFDITPNIVGKTLHINNSCIVNYNTMPLLTTVAIRKVFDGGEIKFSGSIEPIYTGDKVLNGKKGSTAIVDYSAANNTIFIDIRNV